MSVTLWSRFEAIARTRGAAPAVIHGETIVSFETLLEDALQWSGLAAEGVAPGDRVAICAENSAATLAAAAGIWRCGAIPTWVHADAPQGHLEHAADVADVALILTDRDVTNRAEIADRARPLSPPDPGPRPNPARQPGSAPGSILFTSGSTGRPKGAVQAAATLEDGARRMQTLFGYSDEDRILCPIPFAFDYGWGQALSMLLTGVTLVLPQPRNAFGLCEALAAHRPTVLAAVPALLADLVSGLSPIRETPRDSLRLITNTGSKIPATLWETVLELFPDAAISLNYGLTETYRSASLPPEMAREAPDCVGWPVPGVDLAVLRPDGTRCAPEEEGEIVHRGAGVFLGYWGEPDRTAKALRPDPLWPHPELAAPMAVFTGDLGRMDAAGRLFVHGRSDRQLKSMGVRVSPDEIEALVLESGLVAAVGVTAKPHDVIGDFITACVVLPDGADEKEVLKALKRHARAEMSPYMQPRLWLTLAALPRTPSGKTDYARLTVLAREAP